MAQFTGTILTDAGRRVLSAAQSGAPIVITRAAVGTGAPPANPETAEALTQEMYDATVQDISVDAAGQAVVTIIADSDGVAAPGIEVTEIGVWAQDPATGGEVLYTYAYAEGGHGDYLAAADATSPTTLEYRPIIRVDNAASVTAVIDDDLVFATKRDLANAGLAVTLDGPMTVLPGATVTWTLTNYNAASAYSVSSDVGAPTISGDTISLDVPSDAAEGSMTLTVTRDATTTDVVVAVGAQSIATPTITAPVDGLTGASTSPTLRTSAFAVFPTTADTHASTDWQIATDAGFTAPVIDVAADTANLTSLAVSLDTSTTYYIRARHRGATLPASDWSPTVTITTTGYQAPNGTILQSFALPGGMPRALGYDPNTGNLISSDEGADEVYIHAGVSEAITTSFPRPTPSTLRAIVIDPVTGNMITASGDDTIRVHDGISATILNSFSAPDINLKSVGLADGNLVSGTQGDINIHDGISATVTATYPSPAGSDTRGVTYDGRNLLLQSSTTLYVADGISATILTTFSSPETEMKDVVVANGNLVSVGRFTEKIYLHDKG